MRNNVISCECAYRPRSLLAAEHDGTPGSRYRRYPFGIMYRLEGIVNSVAYLLRTLQAIVRQPLCATVLGRRLKPKTFSAVVNVCCAEILQSKLTSFFRKFSYNKPWHRGADRVIYLLDRRTFFSFNTFSWSREFSGGNISHANNFGRSTFRTTRSLDLRLATEHRPELASHKTSTGGIGLSSKLDWMKFEIVAKKLAKLKLIAPIYELKISASCLGPSRMP